MVVVSGLPYVDKDRCKKDEAVVTMVSQFDKQGAVVVAGNGASDGNVVAAIRGDARWSRRSPRSTTPTPPRARW